MTTLTVLRFPDERLRTKAKPVSEITDETRAIVKDMLETMYDEKGVGLAATQVNIHQRIVVIDVSENNDTPYVLINPEITVKSDDTVINEEGCLSLPEIYGDVERPNAVRLRWYDLDGKKNEEDFTGFQAVALQHEFDHLDGKVFIDYFSPLKRRMIIKKLKKKYLS